MIVRPAAIPMPDGVDLAATLYLPDDADAAPVPALLEYLPYRKDDAMLARDHDLYAYMARSGYAGARVDNEDPSRRDVRSSLPLWRYHRQRAMITGAITASRAGLGPAAALFRSLGDPARLAIVRRLAGGPARVTDLAGELGLAQSTVSKHLACLRDCALVTARAQGRASVYSLAPPAEPALPAVLAAAEELLAGRHRSLGRPRLSSAHPGKPLGRSRP